MPNHIKNGLFKPTSHLFMHVLHKQLQLLLSSTVQRIERQDATAFEVKAKVDILMENLKIKQCEEYLSSIIKELLEDLIQDGLLTRI
jgi:hypothetical protein